MTKNFLALIRGLVRPTVTLALVGATIFAALNDDTGGVEALSVLTGMAMIYWFEDRKGKRDS